MARSERGAGGPFGIAHATVVPENFDPERPEEDRPEERSPGAARHGAGSDG